MYKVEIDEVVKRAESPLKDTAKYMTHTYTICIVKNRMFAQCLSSVSILPSYTLICYFYTKIIARIQAKRLIEDIISVNSTFNPVKIRFFKV